MFLNSWQPLNSIPPTTTVENFEKKLTAAKGKCFIDVAFWGGVIPGNEYELKPLLKRGVKGFKCFLLESGVSEFPCVSIDEAHKALKELQGTQGVLLYHAELDIPPAVTVIIFTNACSICSTTMITIVPHENESLTLFNRSHRVGTKVSTVGIRQLVFGR